MTNLVNTNDGKPIAECEPYKIIEHQGFKFGMLGFAEKAWTDTFSPEIDISKMKYIDYNESLKEYSKKLKEEGCDFIYAINHMRLPEDECMAKENTSDIVDICFGGHDHGYNRQLNPDTDVFI